LIRVVLLLMFVVLLQHLMARGDTVTPIGEDPQDLCTDAALKAVNCH
jgi:hypothetical protein